MNVQKNKVKAVFDQVLELPSSQERIALLDQICADDPELRVKVERLLAAYEQAGDFLESPPTDVVATVEPTIDHPITEKPGTQIGPYKLLQEIGHGGMGVVYMAEQKEPVKRRVALKIIKPGMDSRQVIARFEAERQALAMMDHPNIAKVLDAGTTDSGRPYFVMELVNGVRITDYCDEQHLTPRERLELLVPVCQAVQHAHQKGIIHRDLKPSNILIALYDGQAVPKVIDFGVAKATSQTLTDKTLFTQLGQVVGTLEYMSPEQAQRNQLDVDTRSDIYSLGVVLYELLTGTTPFERERLRNAAIDEVLRIIREEEPQRPSLRLSSIETLPSVAANRHTDPQRLRTLVRGELDWIVMTALEKDRARRYNTANDFAEDIQNYLNNDAVKACPPSAAYRFRKFARRNKASLATAGVIFVALLSGATVATWQAVRATRAEQEARTEAAISQAVNDFVNNDLLEFADPEQEPDRNIPLRAVLDRASEEIERFEGAPLVEASIQHTLGKTYLSLGEYKTAEPHLKRAVDLRHDLLGKEHRDTLRSMHLLAQVYHKQAKFKDADRLNEETYTHRLTHLGEEDAETLESMSSTVAIHISLGRYVEAEQVGKRMQDSQRRVLGDDAEPTLTSMGKMAEVAYLFGRYREAERLCNTTLTEMKGVFGDEHPKALAVRSQLAQVYQKLGRHKEAEAQHNEIIAIKQRVLGKEHPDTLKSMHDLALATSQQGRYPEAYELIDRVLKMRQQVLGEEHRDALRSMQSAAGIYALWGIGNDAIDRMEEVLNIQRRVLGREHPDTIGSQKGFAHVIGTLGNYERGLKLQEHTLAVRRRTLGKEHPSTIETMFSIARIYDSAKRYEQSEELFQQVLASQRQIFGKESLIVAETMQFFAYLREDQRRWEDAQELIEQAIEIRRRELGEHHTRTLNLMIQLARARRDHEKERMLREQMMNRRLKELGEDSYLTHNNMRGLAILHRKRGDYARAEEVFKQLLAMQRRGGENYFLMWTIDELGHLYKKCNRHDEARKCFQDVHQYWLEKQGEDHPKTLEAVDNLATLWFQDGHYDNAEELWRQVLRAKPDHGVAARNLCATLLMTKDIEGYRSQCRSFLSNHGATVELELAESVAACFALHPWPSSELERPLELVKPELIESARVDASRLVTVGALLYRTGRLEESLEKLKSAVEAGGADERASEWFWLSMINNALHRPKEARRYYERGVATQQQHSITPSAKVVQTEAAGLMRVPD